jgi:hypothetical protein
LTIKTAFLTLLFNDRLYLMDSEPGVGRRYADVTMILRPEVRQSRMFDLLLEFKFVKPGALGLSGEALRRLSRDELARLPLVADKLAEARADGRLPAGIARAYARGVADARLCRGRARLRAPGLGGS